eukprot:11254166-Alexandrium_andersonii.AAC.1
MVLKIVMVRIRMLKSAQTRSLKLSKCPFCDVVRAEREYGNESLPGAPMGSCFVWLLAPGRG